jgi:hypothetical protein
MTTNYGPEARVKISITLNWQIIIMLSADNESGSVSECILVNMSIFLRKWCCYSALDICFFCRVYVPWYLQQPQIPKFSIYRSTEK